MARKRKLSPKAVLDRKDCEEDFRIPATDLQGQQERLWFAIPPLVRHIVAKYVESQVFPYRTFSHLLRHALIRHLRWLKEQKRATPVLRSFNVRVDAMLAILADDAYNSDFEMVMNKTHEQVQKHFSQGSPDLGRDLLRNLSAQIDAMPSTPQEIKWRRLYRKKFKEKFGGLLD